MKISVIIPVCDAEDHLENAVESALQFSEVHEVILIEDGSYDGSLKICIKLRERYERVRILQHEDKENHGPGPSRNLGIKKADGDYIAFLNAHDHYLPNRFDAEKKMFLSERVEGVYGALGVWYHSKRAKDEYFPRYKNLLITVCEKCRPEAVFPGQLTLEGLFGSLHINTLTLRKDSLLKKMNELFKPIPFDTDKDFLLRVSFYLDLYPGILSKAVAERGIYENDMKSVIIPDEVSPITKKIHLWKSLYEWVEKEETIPNELRLHVSRMYHSLCIGNASLLKRWQMIFKYLMVDYPMILNPLYNCNFRQSQGRLEYER
ncbi:glycosyltransferase family 2 protein [Chryseobacterium rhizoplanae]|uniref:glycosyltransferase family 2 protein n=1 Tax=Chryseobacterium rhizoplanae TaxID=1609531 RepID=UPI001CE2B3FE|nr:glycosyltransferase family A protein [Chryseobacterium rhizoplanae]UCA61804.1 glycosyltransferase family 2 protein [Chryseobacterium rhizoplanae]